MTKVPKEKGNLIKCMCKKCPTYDFACKVKSIPGNVGLILGDMEDKTHAETLFCAYEKSNCIEDEKGCLCPTCELFKEYELGKTYFCTVTAGK